MPTYFQKIRAIEFSENKNNDNYFPNQQIKITFSCNFH